jgi:hypothetical protein
MLTSDCVFLLLRQSSAYAFTVLYNPAITATKLAILMLYYRMSQLRPFFRYATLAVAVIVVLNGFVLTFLNIFQCRPISGAFKEQEATCIDIVTLFICSAPVNVITDIAILVLPLPMVTAMRLDARQKVGLVATFMTGLFVTVVDVVRIAYLQEALIYQIDADELSRSLGLGLGLEVADLSWHASYSLMWSAIEVNVGLICACALVIKPILIRIVTTGKSRSYATSRSGPPALDAADYFQSTPPWTRTPDGSEPKVAPLGSKNDGSADRSRGDAAPPPLSTAPARPGQAFHHPNTIGAHDGGPQMNVFEFLTAADNSVDCPTSIVADQPPCSGRRTSVANGNVQQPRTTFIDFVNLCKRKPLTELTRKEAWWPVLFGEFA